MKSDIKNFDELKALRALWTAAELDLQFARNQYLNALQAVEDYGFDLEEDDLTEDDIRSGAWKEVQP